MFEERRYAGPACRDPWGNQLLNFLLCKIGPCLLKIELLNLHDLAVFQGSVNEVQVKTFLDGLGC